MARHPELLNTGKQPGSIKDSSHFWSRCGLYRRRSIWTPRKSEELFHGGHERRNRICA